jgi:hypothetical protein
MKTFPVFAADLPQGDRIAASGLIISSLWTSERRFTNSSGVRLHGRKYATMM